MRGWAVEDEGPFETTWIADIAVSIQVTAGGGEIVFISCPRQVYE